MPRSTSTQSNAHPTLTGIHLLANRPFRDARRQFWIEGIRQFVQACDANLRFDAIVLSPILLKNDMADMLARRLRVGGVPCLRVTPEAFRQICSAERASGIGAIVQQPWKRLNDLALAPNQNVLVVEEIRNAGNLGTILRTAEATGMAGILFVGEKCDPFDPAVVRASMGAIAHLPLVRTRYDDLARWLGANRVRLIGLTSEAKQLWTDLPRQDHLAIALGEERRGLSARMQTLCESTVRLPMTGRADSLNVGVAAGIMMYELVRRAGRALYPG